MKTENKKRNGQCPTHGIICSACGEIIPEHEKNINHLAKMSKSELEDLECISCEIKYWDSADIDNFG